MELQKRLFALLLMSFIIHVSASAGEIWGGHYYDDGGSWGDRYLFPGETLTLEMPEDYAYVFNSGRAHLADYQWWCEDEGLTIIDRTTTTFKSCTIWGLKPASGQKVKLYLSYTHYSDGYSETKRKMYYFNVTVKAPTQGYITLSANPVGGIVDEGTVVKLSTNVSGADIYYTTNGWNPTPYSEKYTSSGITINSNTTLKARAMKSGGYYMSDVLELNYVLHVPVSNIKLNTNYVDLIIGSTKQLTATISPSNATDKTVTWLSDNTNVATVSSSGLITAVNAGNATITCRANDGSAVQTICAVCVSGGGVEINVTNFPDENFRNFLLNYDLGRDGVLTDNDLSRITTLYLDNRNIERLKGIEYFTSLNYLRCERNKIKGEAMDELIDCLPYSDTRHIVYVYDDTHNDEGNVCTKSQVAAAKARGWIPWYVKSESSSGVYSGSDLLLTSITLSETFLSLLTGQVYILTATVTPNDATDKSVTWTSSDTSIATVDSNGKVTAKSKGSATITCKANDGSGVEATCIVTVTNPKPDNIVLPTSQTVKAGETITLTPTVTPANAEYTLTWTSDDETVATVNSAGVVTGVKKGQTFINVEIDNGKAAYCKLTVTAAEPTGIELPKNATVYVGGTLLLTPTITPEGAETTLTWKSDDETVVRVDATGVLTGLAEGLALVTVKTANGLTSNACKVKVEQDPSGISDVQVGVKANFPVYTLSGQRLAAPRKGINIIGGKKVVVK